MTNLLAKAVTWLADVRSSHMSDAVTYVRGTSEVEVRATIGQSEFEEFEDDQLVSRTRARDFIVTSSDIDFGDGPVEPQAGDVLKETVGSTVHVYELQSRDGEPGWRWSDQHRSQVRIHTRRVREEAI